jgi:hypothetical protein
LTYPRREFVFQPKYAAYPNPIEPWWKVLWGLALKERRFETWEEMCRSVEGAMAYWNGHRHPLVWGRQLDRGGEPPGLRGGPGYSAPLSN